MSHLSTRQPSPERLYAWMLEDPAAPRLIGEIVRQSNGDVGLAYAPTWIDHGFALSADMPLEAEKVFTPVHRQAREPGAPGALDDARPDRWGEKVIRTLYRPGATVFDNLYFAGDERFGAVGVSTSGDEYRPFPQRPLPRLEDAEDLNEAVRIIETGEGELDDQKQALIGAGGSLGGAKPKAVIAIDGEEWVLKFPNGEHYDHPLAEHAAMSLAAKAGIAVAKTQPVPLLGGHAVAVKRFDRDGAGRRHCLSACTLLRAEMPATLAPEFGYPQLARALRRYADIDTLPNQLLDLFRRMVFNILIGNTDDHEKNHALLCRMDGRTMALELSPAYDVVPTGSGATEHQFLISDDSHEPLLTNAMTVAADFDLSPAEASAEITQLIRVVDDWQSHFRACGVTARDLTELAEIIDRPELLSQRRQFASLAQSLKPLAKKRPKRTKAFE